TGRPTSARHPPSVGDGRENVLPRAALREGMRLLGGLPLIHLVALDVLVLRLVLVHLRLLLVAMAAFICPLHQDDPSTHGAGAPLPPGEDRLASRPPGQRRALGPLPIAPGRAPPDQAVRVEEPARGLARVVLREPEAAVEAEA